METGEQAVDLGQDASEMEAPEMDAPEMDGTDIDEPEMDGTLMNGAEMDAGAAAARVVELFAPSVPEPDGTLGVTTADSDVAEAPAPLSDRLGGPPFGGAPSDPGGSSGDGGDGGRAAEDDDAHMTLYEHLAELRKRVFICVLAVVVTSVAGWFLYEPVLSFMTTAYKHFCHHHPGKLLSCNLIIMTPTQGFLTRLKMAGWIGLILAAPVWLWEVWRFITPGLKRNEKRYAVPFVLSAIVLFSMGVGVAVLVWPRALTWLIGVSGSGVTAAYSLNSYVSLYALVCFVFGAVFIYPIIVVFLMISGVVPSAKWRKWRRPAIVLLCGVAAVVTPSNDPFTFLGMAVPMVVFYEASILLGRLLKK
jgi:sec-independent protein translocase protein TatC